MSKGRRGHSGRSNECFDHLGNKYSSEAAMCKFWGVKYTYYAYHIKKGDDLRDILENGTGWGVEKPKNVVTDHLDKEFNSEREMCEYWGVSQTTYYKHIKDGWSVKDALTFKANSTKVVDHLGNKFESKAELCRYHKISRSSFDKRLKRGMSIKDAVAGLLEESYVLDHLGNKYETVEEMCKHYNIKPCTYYSRRESGYDLALSLVLNGGPITDHLGEEFSSIEAMCKHYKLPVNIYKKRRKSGWDNEKALLSDEGLLRDHLGNRYSTLESMCKYHNIAIETYKHRVDDLGYTVEQALTTKSLPKKRVDVDVVKDHKGKCYDNLREMCANYDISISTYSARQLDKWTLEDTLETPEGLTIPSSVPRGTVKRGEGSKVYDHNGKEYGSLALMCKSYNISINVFFSRLAHGWYLKSSLESDGDILKDTDVAYDFNGMEYESLIEMCKVYGISVEAYQRKINSYWDMEKALTGKKNK